jgi:hypothetical protein
MDILILPSKKKSLMDMEYSLPLPPYKPILSLQENHNLVAAFFPHKVPISAKK